MGIHRTRLVALATLGLCPASALVSGCAPPGAAAPPALPEPSAPLSVSVPCDRAAPGQGCPLPSAG